MRTDERELEAEQVRHARELIARLAGVLRALRLYSWEHRGVASAAQRVLQTVRAMGSGRTDVQLAVRADSIFVDGMRVREGGPATASYRTVARLLAGNGIESLTIDGDSACRDIQLCAGLLTQVAEGELSTDDFARELTVRGVLGVEVKLARDEPEEPPEVSQAEVQKRVYLNSINVLKGVFHEASQRDRLSARRVKRVVQQMIDSIEDEAQYLLSLTSIKNYDEYTFNHSVNVGVLSIALGRQVGLSRRQLYTIGQAGMLHDLGKLCVPKQILTKRGRLTPEERLQVSSHPSEGFLLIARNQGVNAETIATALGAYEHHLNLDGSGYPTAAQRREIGLLSRIVSIVDRYDAMTSARIYRSAPISPSKALSILFHSERSRVDQALLRHFANMIGQFPLGTVVRLSNYSVAIVVGSSDDIAWRHMPRVRLVLDELGRPAEDTEVDLAAQAKDDDSLTIIETLNAADYGIEIMDYIV